MPHQILINLQMKKNQSNAAETAQSQNPSFKVDVLMSNPRKAATNLKDVNLHIEIMRNRFKTLQVQDGYHRYRTIDQQKRINLHNTIHQDLQRERQQLKKSLQKLNDTSDLKDKTDKLKKGLRENLQQARRHLHGKRVERTNSIYSQYADHIQKIKQNRQKDLQENRDKSSMVKFQEEQKRESVSRHVEERKISIHLNKSIDSQTLIKEKEKREMELSRLIRYEQELLKKNSESLQASQVMRHRFNQVFNVSSTYNGASTYSSSPRMLPEIKPRANSQKDGSKREIVMI